jgi:hypothetical protein
MSHGSRIRFSIEIALAGLTGKSFLLALVQRGWIEAVLGFSPDCVSGIQFTPWPLTRARKSRRL